MLKELLSKNIIGIMGVSLTASIAVLTYQLMTTLFVQATLNALNAMPH